MANFTIKTFELVLYKSNTVQFRSLMAFFAGYAYVFALEFKPGFIVIKIVHIPAIEAMTTRAVGNAFLFELPVVGIFVA